MPVPPSPNRLSIVILAAGQGTRMRSALPKVMHRLAGRTLLEHVVESARGLGADARVIVVYGHGGRLVPDALAHLDVEWVEQAEQLGTGHAVRLAMASVPDDDRVLVLYGDVPLISGTTLQRLLEAAGGDGAGLLTARLPDPSGYGRVVRDAEGSIRAIVEDRDATPAQAAIDEINTGMMAMPARRLRDWLGQLQCTNAQGEYYLTDVIALAVRDGVAVRGVSTEDAHEFLGVNDRVQLAELERIAQRRAAERLMRAGVTLIDPARFDLRGTLKAGSDVVIDINAVFEGDVVLGDGVQIGPNCYLRDSEIGPGTELRANCVIEQSRIGGHCQIGPYARLRPETILSDEVKVGNFVEIKKSQVAVGSKIPHLSYVGDSTVGRNVNIGAGTITCNYDGANKYSTVIEDGAFIGSDTQLVAPVRVGADAVIGAGSTVTRDAPPGTLTLSRSRQTTVAGWKRPQKKRD